MMLGMPTRQLELGLIYFKLRSNKRANELACFS